MADPSNPRRPKPPAAAPPIPPPRKPIPPGSGKPSGNLPAGKAVPSQPATAKVRAVTPGDSMPRNIGAASSGGFRAVRRRGTPAVAWFAVALGVVAAAGLGYFVYDQQLKKKDDQAPNQPEVAAHAEEIVDPVEAAPLEDKNSANTDNAKPRAKKETAPSNTSPKKKPSDGKSSDRPKDDKNASKKGKSADAKTPPRFVVRVSSFGSARDAPADEAPAELSGMIEEGLNLLDDARLDDFMSKFVYPTKPSDSEAESDEDDDQASANPPSTKPTGKAIAGIESDRLRLALKHIRTTEAKPRFPLDDRSVAVFTLSDRTQLHFVQVEKQWRLHRYHAVRFRRLSPQDRLVALLARESAKEAVKPTEDVVGEARIGVISKLEAMNAVVAVSADAEDQRAAVLLGPKYSGGLEGMKLFAQLGNLEMLVCESPPGFDDNMLAELDEMDRLRYLKLVGVASPLPITLHFRDLTRLESLIVEGGLMEDIHMEHLSKLASLKRLTIFGRGLSDAALDRLQPLAALRELTLEIRPAGSFSGDAVARLRRAVPNLWVDW